MSKKNLATENPKDNVWVQGKKWEFDSEVTKCFEDMLSRSIPEYGIMRALVSKIAARYVQRGTAVVDIGCSLGDAIFPLFHQFGSTASYKLYDVSEPMLEECRRRFEPWIREGMIEVKKHDITEGLPKVKTSVVLSILTLQFTPIEYRQRIVKSIYENLENGGVLLLVEKVLGNTYDLDEVFVDEYYKIKEENAYTREQIMNKRKSLEGVLVPITAKWNESMLHDAGFREVDCFWRCLNFAGWLAVK